MLLFSLINSPLQFLFFISILIIALTVHEFAHALAADRLGDSTPRLTGRLTLNPLAHLDPIGSLFLLIAGFGWGKPVMVNPNNFEKPELDNLAVSLAGPISNFILALIFGLAIRFLPLSPVLQEIFFLGLFFNLVLMTFNLIPLPPLDGSKILPLFLPESVYQFLEQWGMYILLFLVLFSSSIPVIPFIMNRAIGFFISVIVGQNTSF